MRTTISSLSLLVLTSLALVGCEAFNDHPQEQDLMPQDMRVGGSTDGVNGSLGVPDFASDTTACAATSTVKVTLDPKDVSPTNGGWTTDTGLYAVNGEAIGTFTQKITIRKSNTQMLSGDGDMALAFTVKQTSAADLAPCDVQYSEAGSAYTVKSGSVTFASFNDKAKNGKSSGSYSLTVAPQVSASKAEQALIGGTAGGAEKTVEGTFVTGE